MKPGVSSGKLYIVPKSSRVHSKKKRKAIDMIINVSVLLSGISPFSDFICLFLFSCMSFMKNTFHNRLKKFLIHGIDMIIQHFRLLSVKSGIITVFPVKKYDYPLDMHMFCSILSFTFFHIVSHSLTKTFLLL